MKKISVFEYVKYIKAAESASAFSLYAPAPIFRRTFFGKVAEEGEDIRAESAYCRAYIYENAEYLYLPEMKLLFGEVKRAVMQSSAIDTNAVAWGSTEIRERYFSTPLSAMKKDPVSYSDVVLRAADIIEKLEL